MDQINSTILLFESQMPTSQSKGSRVVASLSKSFARNGFSLNHLANKIYERCPQIIAITTENQIIEGK